MPQVKLLGGMAPALGKRVLVRAKSVAELLETLGSLGGPALAERLFSDSGVVASEPAGRAPNRDLRVLVNGRSIAFLQGLETELHEADVVTLHLTGVRGYPGG